MPAKTKPRLFVWMPITIEVPPMTGSPKPKKNRSIQINIFDML